MNFFDNNKLNKAKKINLTVDQMLQKANEGLMKGKIQEAEMFYRTILNANPENPDANHNLALIQISKNKSELALPLFKKAVEVNPNIEQFWLSYIDALIVERQFDNAELALKKVIHKVVSKENYKILTQKLLSIKSNNYLIHNPPQSDMHKLLNHYQNGQFNDAENLASSLSKQFPNHPFSWKILGALFGQAGREVEALNANQIAVQLAPQDASVHNNLANTLRGMGRLKDAEANYRQAIAIKPDFAEAYNNLGTTMSEMGRLKDAETNYRHATVLKSNFAEAYFNLGVMFFEANEYKKAIEQFKSTDFGKSKSYLLRCLYLEDEKSLFFNQLDYLINQGEITAIIGSLGCRSALKYGIEKPNLFCKDPLKYVLNVNLKNKYDFEKIFIDTALTILNEDKIPYRDQTLLTNGRQTSGNLFNLEPEFTKEIQAVICAEVDNYKAYYKDSKEGLIVNWPDDYSISGWLISMKSGSKIKPHMHECGWLSGSVYINVPPKKNIDSGNLVVCIEDEEYLDGSVENPKNIIDVVTGSLALFPASLLHYTIPFASEDDRIVLAFDVIPKQFCHCLIFYYFYLTQILVYKSYD